VNGGSTWSQQLDAIGKSELVLAMPAPKVGSDVVGRQEKGYALVAGCNDELDLDTRRPN
jgi:hypothetical protein